MKILIAPNSYKGTLSSPEAARAIERGISRIFPPGRISLCPLSDGGDGLTDVVSSLFRGRMVRVSVEGPLGAEVDARYFLSEDGAAFIEMAEASGIKYLKKEELNCLKASTYGTGQLMRDAAERGAAELIVGMGGSASNDGGAGCASGFGFRLLDSAGKEIPRGAEGLAMLKRILKPDVRIPRVTALADVENPLCGDRGSARVFGPQKGAGPREVGFLENALEVYADTLSKELGVDVRNVRGGAAAGGLGAGLFAFFGAEIKNGASFVFDICGMTKRIRESDLIITGEGKFDTQSLEGKAFREISSLAKSENKKIIVVCGRSEVPSRLLGENNVEAVVQIADFFSEKEIFSRPGECLEKTVISALSGFIDSRF